MAQAGPQPSRYYVERQSLTRSPATPTPPTDRSSAYAFGQQAPAQGSPLPGDGLALGGLFAVVVSVYPWVGQTLSGAGTLRCWVWNPYEARWTRNDDLDLDLSTASGFPARTFTTLTNVSRLGMLINWLCDSVTVSGGTDVLVRIDGFTSTGPRGT